MKLFEAFSTRGFHTTITTAFCADFFAYEEMVLPRLREVGCNNNLLILDERMLAYAMDDIYRRPKLAGRRYSVTGARAEGVFHPKITLQLGTSTGRLLVSSANMTSAGLANNLEIVGEIQSTAENPRFVPLLRRAVEFVASFVDAHSPAGRQLAWGVRRSPWLSDGPSQSTIELETGERLSFLSSKSSASIHSAFVQQVGRRRVMRLVVMSPYWDPGLNALRALRTALRPESTAVLIQPHLGLFPKDAWSKAKGAKIFDAANIEDFKGGRFTHAKIIIAETEDADCVLYGSANCTLAALGRESSRGSNEEACFYRETAPGVAVSLLKLKGALKTALNPDELPAYAPSDERPISSLSARLPGEFELRGEILCWLLPSWAKTIATTIILFDQTGKELDARLTRVETVADLVKFRLASSEG